MDQEFRSGLAWRFGLGSHGVAAKLLGRATVIWKHGWGWRITFQDDSLTWLLAIDLFFSMWTCIGLLECPHDLSSGFPQSKRTARVYKIGARISFMTYPHIPPFHNIILVHKSALFSVGGNYTMLITNTGYPWGPSSMQANIISILLFDLDLHLNMLSITAFAEIGFFPIASFLAEICPPIVQNGLVWTIVPRSLHRRTLYFLHTWLSVCKSLTPLICFSTSRL